MCDGRTDRHYFNVTRSFSVLCGMNAKKLVCKKTTGHGISRGAVMRPQDAVAVNLKCQSNIIVKWKERIRKGGRSLMLLTGGAPLYSIIDSDYEVHVLA
jgi:hypothetical protein